MDSTLRPSWRAAMIFVMAALFILTGNHESATADQMPLKVEIERLPDRLFPKLARHMLSVDAADGVARSIGSALDNFKLLTALEERSERRIFDADLTFMRWLREQRCADGKGRNYQSALVCARQCDTLFFGWSDEHVSQLKLVVKSSLVSSEYPFAVTVGPDGWSLHNYRARWNSLQSCVANPVPKEAPQRPWIRQRYERLSLLAPDPAKELGLPMQLERLQLDVRDWPGLAKRQPCGQRLSDEQLARILTALLASPAVRKLSLTWAPDVSYPAVLQAIDQSLASRDSRVAHLQIVETGCGTMETEKQELLPSLVEHAALENWKRIRSVAVKWTLPDLPQNHTRQLTALRDLTERLPNFHSVHVEQAHMPLDELSCRLFWDWIGSSERLGTTRSLYWKGFFIGVAPNAVGTVERQSYTSRLMLPWLDVDGNSRYDLEPLGDEVLHQTSSLTLYAGKAVSRARPMENLAIGQAEGLARLVVESGQEGVFCNRVVQRLPAELPASTRHLVLRTFELVPWDYDALSRLEAVIAGNPSLASIVIGLDLLCIYNDNKLRLLKDIFGEEDPDRYHNFIGGWNDYDVREQRRFDFCRRNSDLCRHFVVLHSLRINPDPAVHFNGRDILTRILRALESRIEHTAVRIELSTRDSCSHQLDRYLEHLHAAVPLTVVRRSAPNVNDVATRLHSGSLIYE